MALNKRGIDVSAIKRDQAAIDKLPNKGRASVDHSKSNALAKRTSERTPMSKEHAVKRSMGQRLKKYGKGAVIPKDVYNAAHEAAQKKHS